MYEKKKNFFANLKEKSNFMGIFKNCEGLIIHFVFIIPTIIYYFLPDKEEKE